MIPSDPEQIRGQVPVSPRRKKIDLLIFLLFMLPPLVLSLLSSGELDFEQINLRATILATGLQNAVLLALIFFFLWRNREPVARIFWTKTNFIGEVFRGVLLFIPIFLVIGLFEQLLRYTGLSSEPNPMQNIFADLSASAIALSVALMIFVSLAEETIFRGYLLRRFKDTLGSPSLAVFLSSLLFAFGHGYQGTAALIVIFCFGVILAVITLRTNSLVAPMTIHFLNNSVAILVWAYSDFGHFDDVRLSIFG